MKNKILYTFLVPCYNGKEFINNSFHSLMNERLLNEGIMDMYEVILISDGSTDNSVELAQKWADEWNKKVRRNFVRIIEKENGQYGSVINKGLKLAKGIYFKVLDVDDTFHISSLIKLIYITAGFKKQVDAIFTDHTFEKVGKNIKETLSLRDSFEPNIFLDINKVKFPTEIITMHSIIYRTKLLREINYKQVEGVFYSDSQYSLLPLNHVKIIYYINLPLYRYYIGRGEQSINLKVMIRNMDHQFKVRENIFKQVNFDNIKSTNLKKYYYSTMKQMIQWSIMLIAFNHKLKNKKKAIQQIIKFTKETQSKDFTNIFKGPYLTFVWLTKGWGISWMTRFGVKIYSKFKKNILAEWD